MDARIALRTSSGTVSMSQKTVPHFQDTDPRYLPTYTLSEASHYLLIPIATLRSWVVGRYYPVREGRGFFKPPILVPQKNPIMLSFVNLIEAHVLDAVRRDRKSTRLNSSHVRISYAVFCLEHKKRKP